MKNNKMLILIGIIVVAIACIGAGIVFIINNNNPGKENLDKNKEIQENKTLEDLIKYDQEDASTGFWVEDSNDFISIGSVSLDSNVAEKKVVITFNVTAKQNITSPMKGTFELKNDQDEVLETLTFDIPVLAEKESAPIELISNNLKTILATNLTFAVE